MLPALRGVLFTVYGYEDGVAENEFTVVREESEPVAAITSLIDRDAILERLDLWIEDSRRHEAQRRSVG